MRLAIALIFFLLIIPQASAYSFGGTPYTNKMAFNCYCPHCASDVTDMVMLLSNSTSNQGMYIGSSLELVKAEIPTVNSTWRTCAYIYYNDETDYIVLDETETTQLDTFIDEGNSTDYEVDALGRRTRVTDAEGSSTAYEYDSAGRLVAVVDAVAGTTRYTYDALGRLAEQRDALKAQNRPDEAKAVESRIESLKKIQFP